MAVGICRQLFCFTGKNFAIFMRQNDPLADFVTEI